MFLSQASAFDYSHRTEGVEIIVSQSAGLDLIRELSARQQVNSFRISFDDDLSRTVVLEFIASVKSVREAARGGASENLESAEVSRRLKGIGFERELTQHQLEDVSQLLSLRNGANFSVPGAGKTTVTLATSLLALPGASIIVVAPKSAFRSWESVVGECMSAAANDIVAEPFSRLSGGLRSIEESLSSGHRRYVINYEMTPQAAGALRSYMSVNPTHLVIDESHRIKAGNNSQRGSVALRLAGLAVRRDILSGTPMPQGASDIAAQADFLWPGAGIGRSINRGTSPSNAFSGLFVRTTKSQLNLPEYIREFVSVPMNPAQATLYSVLRDRTIAQFTAQGRNGVSSQVRSSVVRLLQASVNPGLTAPAFPGGSPILDAAIDEGPSPKMLEAVKIARENADHGRKTVIWSTFTDTLFQLNSLAGSLNPVIVYGGNKPGGEGLEIDRDVALDKFADDSSCFVLLANPAAASEGLSLHLSCHEAIYVDRNYNAAHYLQSIDRIHRLGMNANETTRMVVLQSMTPIGVGNVDWSVSRRLKLKTSNLADLLDDGDLREIAMSEDDVPIPDAELNRDDVIDLIRELESPQPAPDSY
jgi:SNF2 family DNA or RNA helicase